jgi:hypothetical protein
MGGMAGDVASAARAVSQRARSATVVGESVAAPGVVKDHQLILIVKSPPGDSIGHACIGFCAPDQDVFTRGFWPKSATGGQGYGVEDLEFKRNPIRGMEGLVVDDAWYWNNRGNPEKHINTKTYNVTEAQYQSALSEVATFSEKLEGSTLYKLLSNNCASFACNVLKSAGQTPPSAGIVPRPSALKKAILNED